MAAVPPSSYRSKAIAGSIVFVMLALAIVGYNLISKGAPGPPAATPTGLAPTEPRNPTPTAATETTTTDNPPPTSTAASTVPATMDYTKTRARASGNAQGLVYWQAPNSDGGSPMLQYRIQAYDFTASRYLDFQYASPSARTFTYSGLTNGHTYNFKVEAINAVGPSQYVFTNTISPPAYTGP